MSARALRGCIARQGIYDPLISGLWRTSARAARAVRGLFLTTAGRRTWKP
jgi:hypothetical protein